MTARRGYRRTRIGDYEKMLTLYRKGYGYTRIGKMLDVHPVTVGNYIRSVVPGDQRHAFKGTREGLAPWASRQRRKS
jgi:hypothetical protein